MLQSSAPPNMKRCSFAQTFHSEGRNFSSKNSARKWIALSKTGKTLTRRTYRRDYFIQFLRFSFASIKLFGVSSNMRCETFHWSCEMGDGKGEGLEMCTSLPKMYCLVWVTAFVNCKFCMNYMMYIALSSRVFWTNGHRLLTCIWGLVQYFQMVNSNR